MITARRIVKSFASTPVLAALPVPAGAYRLRIAAVDEAGRGGALDMDVRARLPRGEAVALSGIILATERSGAMAPRLVFSAEPAATAYLELYGAPAGSLSARFELAQSETGPAIAAVPAQIGPPNAAGDRSVSASLPLGSLPVGDMMVRALIEVDGRLIAQVGRTLRKQ
jgi:hypothetical protein